PGRQRQLMIDVLVELAIGRSRHQPVLLVFEDLHWADPSTLDLMTQLIGRIPQERQLAVLSCRADVTPPWDGDAVPVRIDLKRLDRAAAERIVAGTADSVVPHEMLDQ